MIHIIIQMYYKGSFFLILYLAVCAFSQSGIDVLSVSGKPDVVERPYSSLKGGALVYINVIGHSTDPRQNTVTVGDFPCIVPSDGVNDNFITCETTDTGSSSNLNNLKVTIKSGDFSFTASSQNGVYFQTTVTPALNRVYPSTSFSGGLVQFYGRHEISDLGDGRSMGQIKKLKIGNDLCSRFDILQDDISVNSWTYIDCKMAPTHEAGKYLVTEQVEIGFAENSAGMKKSSLVEGEDFEFAVLPSITEFSPNSGNIGGQFITVKGTGFSPKKEENIVKVDGTECQVTSASLQELECTLKQRDPSSVQLLSTDSSAQTNGYFSGAGLDYTRYSCSGLRNSWSVANFKTAVDANDMSSLGEVLEEGHRAELREWNTFVDQEDYYGQVFKGYFTAPADGVYTFRGTADDTYGLYISDSYGSAELPASPLISSSSYQSSSGFFYTDTATSEATKTLVAGKSYYMELYHLNWWGSGSVYVSVDVPNTNTALPNQVHAVQKIKTQSTVREEVKTFTFVGGSSGNINLRLIRTNAVTLKTTYDENTTIAFDCSASTFESALNTFANWKSYTVTVTKEYQDANGGVVADLASSAQIAYKASVYQLRSDSEIAEKLIVTYLDGYTGTLTEQSSVTHSPLMSGTFSLTFGGVSVSLADNGVYNKTDIPYDVSASDLQDAIRQFVGFEETTVIFLSEHGAGYASTWVVQFIGYNDNVLVMVPNAVGLTGGVGSPTATVVDRRQYSSHVIFDPIDFRFLNTAGNEPQISVMSNGISAVCQTNCGYTFETLSEIKTLSLAGNTLSFSIDDQMTLGIAASDLSVKVGMQTCTVDTGAANSALTCTLPLNSDGSAKVVAGQITPLVSAGVVGGKNVGIIGLDDGVARLLQGNAQERLLVALSPIDSPLTVTSVSPSSTTTGTNGGQFITMVGHGFPQSEDEITIMICSQPAKISTISNIQVVFYLPKCANIAAETVTVTVNGKEDTSQAITYVDGSSIAPQVTAISPASFNPSIKGFMEVTGSGFGTDPDVVNVWLLRVNATDSTETRAYNLKIINITATSIWVGVPGGLAGNYKLRVGIPTLNGDSIASPATAEDFAFEFVIDSISPTTGSAFGGTLVTITGKNFDTDKTNTHIYVGDVLNWFCTIETLTSTQITCRTPPAHSSYNVSQSVVGSTKLITLSTCSSTCMFTYVDAASSPTLSSISVDTVEGGDTLTFSGSGFGTSCSTSFTNKLTAEVTQVAATSCTDTSAAAVIPNDLAAGMYYAKVRRDTGETLFQQVKVELVAGSAPSFSTQGGVITLTGGSGFPAELPDDNFKVSLKMGSTAITTEIVSCCSNNQISIRIPAGVSGTSYTIDFTTTDSNNPSVSFSQTDAATPALTYTPASHTAGAIAVDLVRASGDTDVPTSIVLASSVDATKTISGSISQSGNTINFEPSDVGSGKYDVIASHPTKGYYSVSSQVEVTRGSITYSPESMSFNGGKFKVTGHISPGSYLTVNSQKAMMIEHSTSESTFQIPALITPTTQSTYALKESSKIDISSLTLSGDDTTSSIDLSFDDDYLTTYSSSNTACFIRMDFGADVAAHIDRIRWFSNTQWSRTNEVVLGAQFKATNDPSGAWVDLGNVDQTSHSGWNTLKIDNVTTPYRYFQFSHTDMSRCAIPEMQLYGITYTTSTATTFDVIFDDGLTPDTWSNQIEYLAGSTAVVTSISPRYGDIDGGYTLTLNGNNLAGTASIMIDGVECTGASGSASIITCTVGARTQTPSTNTFSVMIGNNKAVIQEQFMYVLKWSDQKTWGTDMPPIDDDVVIVPEGMSLLVDQNTPVLNSIIVEKGNLIFDDSQDLVVQANKILIKGGKFIAGTESHPHASKLTFIMSGDYYGTQLPMFGNKVIACYQCKFSMHGIERDVTWTHLDVTIAPETSSVTLIEPVDWQVGEEIVVSSTGFDRFEAERRTISTRVSSTVFTVSEPFKNEHHSGQETYGTHTLKMKAEVGLLTRNIKMRGDDVSYETRYGSHLMMGGSAENGLESHIAYTEFQHCGQPRILGRYCIHFHMNGHVPTSYVKGNAVHDSFARVVTIHGVHYLTVEKNVGYDVSGHNYFVEDGIETHNTIKGNLAMISRAASNMLSTDTSVASFWITNPANYVSENAAAGSQFYGFWYEIKEHPDGPSATNDVCPEGLPLYLSKDNIAHSNHRFGLRLFILSSRKYPCRSLRNESAADPWADNPSEEAVFQNFMIYKNGEAGLLVQETGHTVFRNFTIAQNAQAGIEFYHANFTMVYPEVVDSVVIIQSKNNPDLTNVTRYSLSSGLITTRSGDVNIVNTHFYNVPAVSHCIALCSKCNQKKLFTVGGAHTFLKQVTFNNVSGNYVKFIGYRQRDIVYDVNADAANSISSYFDSTSRTSGTITRDWPHLLQNEACVEPTTTAKWGGAIICDQRAKVLYQGIRNLNTLSAFVGEAIKVRQIATYTETVAENETVFSETVNYLKESKKKYNMQEDEHFYNLPFITGQFYQVWWGTGIDFDNLAIQSDYLFTDADKAVGIKFNYTTYRQIYEIGKLVSGSYVEPNNLVNTSANETGATLDLETCQVGDYVHNNTINDTTRYMAICQSGKGKESEELTQVDAIYCRYICPENGVLDVLRQDFPRMWSNATQWPDGVVPVDGQNVTVPYAWRLILDQSTANLSHLTVDGILTASMENESSIVLTSQSIFVRAGQINAGTADEDYSKEFIIRINGQKSDRGVVFDPHVAGNKIMVVTGAINLFGNSTATVQTTLKSTATAGSNTIQVNSASNWVVGDELGLSPSFNDPNEYERVTIQAISGNTITLEANLMYTHYGANSIQSYDHGSIDTRTQVAHLTRNIRFESGDDAGWGYTIYVYAYFDDAANKTRIGQLDVNKVHFESGGQYDTENGPIVFKSANNQDGVSKISKSSFTHCKALCINALSGKGAQITNNVFFESRVFHVRLLDFTNFEFTNNLLIGTIKKTASGGYPIVCFAAYTTVTTPDDGIQVKNNYCSGSQEHGFVLPYIHCDHLEANPWANNTAGSAVIGFFFNSKVTLSCNGFSYIAAHSSTIGQLAAAFGGIQQIFQNFILVDNGRGGTMRFGHSDTKDSVNFTGQLKNSYFNPVSRTGCNECYGSGAISCSGNHGLRMLTVSANSQSLPSKHGTGLDVVCKQELADAKAFLYNVQFENFKNTYTGDVSQCSNNFAFRPHGGATDLTAGHNLFDCTCTDCETGAFAKIDAPSESQKGWFGGCGDITCTGKRNYLIQDHTSTFFDPYNTGKKTLIPSHSLDEDFIDGHQETGKYEAGCEYFSTMPAYLCDTLDFATLEYQSIAKDFKTRIMWPVNLTYEGSNSSYVTRTNGFIEWEWNGNEPMNKRIGRFFSVAKLNETYNMTFASQPPVEMQMQIQQRTPTGNAHNFMVIKLHYPLPNMIRIYKNGNLVDPLLWTDNGLKTPLDTTVCGSNAYFYFNYTTHFVVTEEPDCLITIKVEDTIQLTTHFSMDATDFYNDDTVMTSFINAIVALLQIDDYSRVKIVGVETGSSIVTTAISPNAVDDNNQTIQASSGADPSMATTSAALNAAIQNGALEAAMTNASLPLLTASSTLTVLPTTETEEQEERDNIGLIVGVTVASIVIIAAVIFTVVYCMRRRARVMEEVKISEGEVSVHYEDVKEDKDLDIRSFDNKPSDFKINANNNQNQSYEMEEQFN